MSFLRLILFTVLIAVLIAGLWKYLAILLLVGMVGAAVYQAIVNASTKGGGDS